jgi:ribosomal-protein-alanine N-acetyltransferase
VLIRQATPADLPSIRALERGVEPAAHWSEQQYESLFAPEAPRRLVFVAIAEAEVGICGFVIAACASEDWEIENLVVSPHRRRMGVATGLVGELLRAARQAAAVSVLLEVRESNTAARQLYQQLGFTESGRRPGYYREPLEDALLLKISISVS